MVFPARVAGKILCKKCLILLGLRKGSLRSIRCTPERSALGQKQTFAVHQPMSALPPKADMCSATRHVRLVPIADIRCQPIPERRHMKAATLALREHARHGATDGESLHLVEHVRECRLELERFLDFFATHVGMLAVFEEAWPLVFAEKLDYGRRIGRVVRWPSFEGLKGRLDARLSEEDRGIFAVFIEIGIEDALVHHVALPLNGEDHPPQVVCLEYSERGRIICDCFLYDLGMVVYVLFPSQGMTFAMTLKP